MKSNNDFEMYTQKKARLSSRRGNISYTKIPMIKCEQKYNAQ